MASYLTRNAVLYISTAPESSINTPVTTGANFKRVVADNPIVKIIGVENETILAGPDRNGCPAVQYLL